MKKILLTICLAAASLTSFAQYYDEPTATFGVKGGLNLASIQQSVSGMSGSGTTGNLTTFSAGLFANFTVSEAISIQPALLYMGKGAKQSASVSMEFEFGTEESASMSSSAEAKLKLFYLHVPVNVLYNIPVGDNKFFFGAGPFISYGLSGKSTGNSYANIGEEEMSSNTTQNITFGDGEDQIKRLDYGVGALVGFKFYNGFSINANYDYGLANIQSITYPEFNNLTFKAKTRGLGLTVGFEF